MAKRTGTARTLNELAQRIGEPVPVSPPGAAREPAGGGGYQAWEGARPRPSDPDFMPRTLGPNVEAERDLRQVRANSRWLAQNHPLIRGAKARYVSNVGSHRVEPNTGNPEIDKVLRDAYWRHCELVDVDRCMSLEQIHELASESKFEDGEYLVNHVVTPAWRGVPMGPAIELVETDRLELGYSTWGGGTARTGQERIPEGNFVRQSVEFDALGRRVAYHVLDSDPNDGGLAWGGRGFTRVRKSSEFYHLAFDRRRQSQIRGVPPSVAVIQGVREEQLYREACILQAQVAASLGVYFKGLDPPNIRNGKTPKFPCDASGQPMFGVSPGAVGFLGAGKDVDVKTVNGNLPGPTFQSSLEVLWLRIASGLDLSYVALTRDASKTNYAGQRIEHLQDIKSFRRHQKRLAENVTFPWWDRVVAWEVLNGRVPLTSEEQARYAADPRWLFQCTVVFDGWELIDPLKEASAAAIEVELGMNDPKSLAASRGKDWKDTVDARLDVELYEQRQREALGLPPRAAAKVTVNTAPSDEKDDQDDKGKNQPKPPEKQEKASGPGARPGPRAGFHAGSLVGSRMGRHFVEVE